MLVGGSIGAAVWSAVAWIGVAPGLTEASAAWSAPGADKSSIGVEPPVPVAVAAVPAAAGHLSPAIPGGEPRLPAGKGMWIWQPDRTEGADVNAVVERAVSHDLTHVYVRSGSSVSGLHGAEFIAELLPVAHQAGIRVYAWDFPYLNDVADDVARAMTIIEMEVHGHRIDGFVADVETGLEGVNIGPATSSAYGEGLRSAVGGDYPLVVAVPRPTGRQQAKYPYADIVPHFSAVAPMLYWRHLGHDPADDVGRASAWLAQFGKPVAPIGQAYDARDERGPAGHPPPEEIAEFIDASESLGSPAVSFRVWESADEPTWEAIANAPNFAGDGTPWG